MRRAQSLDGGGVEQRTRGQSSEAASVQLLQNARKQRGTRGVCINKQAGAGVKCGKVVMSRLTWAWRLCGASRLAAALRSAAREARAGKAGRGLERLWRRHRHLGLLRRSLAGLGARHAHGGSCARDRQCQHNATPGASTAAAAVRAGNACAQSSDALFFAVLGRPRVGDVTGEAAGARVSSTGRGSGERDANVGRAAGFSHSAVAASAAEARPPSLGVAAAVASVAAPNVNESLAAAPRRPPRGDAGAGGGARLLLDAPPRVTRFGAVRSRSASVPNAASATAHAAKPGSCENPRASAR